MSREVLDHLDDAFQGLDRPVCGRKKKGWVGMSECAQASLATTQLPYSILPGSISFFSSSLSIPIDTVNPISPFLHRRVHHEAHRPPFLSLLPLLFTLLLLCPPLPSQHRQPDLTARLVVAQLATNLEALGFAVCVGGVIVMAGRRGGVG